MEAATNKGINDFVARKEREQRGKEFWAALDQEVYQMRYQRLLISAGLQQEGRLPKVKVTEDIRMVYPIELPRGRQRVSLIKDDTGKVFADHTAKKIEVPKKNKRQTAPDRSLPAAPPIAHFEFMQPKNGSSYIQKDKRLCYYCEELPGSTIDHIIATSQGGSKNGAYNKVYACPQCNNAKGNFSLQVFLDIISTPELLTERRFGKFSQQRVNKIKIKIVKLIDYVDSNKYFKKHDDAKNITSRPTSISSN